MPNPLSTWPTALAALAMMATTPLLAGDPAGNGPGTPAHIAEASTSAATPRFEAITPCPFEAAAGVDPERLRCGHLVAPMDRSQPALGEVRVPVAIIRTLSETPKPDPVVFIAGGPGAAPVTSARTFTLFSAHRFGQDRDVILYTQRGGMGAVPELRCDALRDLRRRTYLADQSLAERDQAITETAVACLNDLQARGLPPGPWSTVENALDLRDLRRALGIDEWNLAAVSYGTLIALETARVDPEGVRAMVLDSLVSPESDLFIGEAARNFADGIERVFAACEADPACVKRFPDLRGSLARVVERFREAPVTLVIDGPPVAGNEAPAGADGATDGPATAGTLDMVVNWHDFLGLLHWMTYNVTTVSWMPLLVDETDQGRYAFLQRLLSQVFPAPALAEDDAAGAFFAVVCRDQYHPAGLPGPQDDRFDGYAMSGFMASVCSDPDLGYGGFPRLDAVSLETPTLLLAGRFDLITPERYANQVLHGLSNGALGRVANFGHSTLSGYTACQTDIAGAFFDAPDAETDLGCLAELRPPVFLNSADALLEHWR